MNRIPDYSQNNLQGLQNTERKEGQNLRPGLERSPRENGNIGRPEQATKLREPDLKQVERTSGGRQGEVGKRIWYLA